MHFRCSILIIIILWAKAAYAVEDGDFLSAKFIKYDQEERSIEAIGDVTIIAGKYLITADRMFYHIDSDELWAKGNIRITDGTEKIVVGDSVYFKDKFKQGIVRKFAIYFGENSILAADKAHRTDSFHANLTNATYTPCTICGNKEPLWQISAKKTEMDLVKERVTYKNAFFEVYGVPVLFIPYFAHPTPHAKAQSGFLVPSVKNGGMKFPLYYRPKSNLDFTLSPRISKNNIIYEAEVRYLTENGTYHLDARGTRSRIITRNQAGDITNDAELRRYYVASTGDTVDSNKRYGFDLRHVSDKALLKNYYDIHAPYLTSKIYGEKVYGSNFYRIDSLYFQGLRAEDRMSTNALVLPELRVKQVANIDDTGNTYLTLENNTLGYGEGSSKRIARTSFSLSLTHLYKTDNGHLFNIKGYNRGDWYSVNIHKNGQKREQVLTRYIPELHLGWRYPLVRTFENKSTFLEPQGLLVIGCGNYNQNLKYATVDTGYYFLSEENIFRSNRYSGIDFHEYGTRLSYGLDSTTDLAAGYRLNGFLGRLYYLSNKQSPNAKSNVIGRIALNYQDNTDFYYRFKASKYLIPYHEEIGVSSTSKKIQGNIGIVHMKPVGYYEYISAKNVARPRVRQGFVSITYSLDDRWSIGSDTRFNIDRYDKATLLYRSLKVGYMGDCISLETKFGNDYTSDARRNVKKTSNYWVMIGLKTLNM